jgi:serine/threonine-protein kinase
VTLGREHIAQALPNYVIGEEVGRGAWGVVLKGEHRRLGRQVAIKELPQAFAADPGVQRRFASEARLLASLDHPHIVPIFDYVEEDQLCLLVMELLPGGTVWDRVTTDGVTAEMACSIVLATCSALHYAHRKGILHRDIKPENLLFGASGALKVTDFGIAKVLGGVETFATRTGEVLGTPAYIAPEQALARELTPATDVYAVGTLLYELLSGQLPFADDGNAIALLYRHVHEPPTPLLDVAPTVPPLVADVTMRALATDPADRYHTAEEFGADVAEAASGGWGSDWVRRAGLSVMASGEIAARLSGGGRLWQATAEPDGAPAATPAPAAPTEAREPPAEAAPRDAAPGDAAPTPAAPTGPPRMATTRASGHRPAAVDAPTPDDLVAVQDVLPERLSELRQTSPDARPTTPDSRSTPADTQPAVPDRRTTAPETAPPASEAARPGPETQPVAPPPPPGAGPTADERPPRRSRRWILLGGAAALVVVAVVVVVVVTQLGGGGSGGGGQSSSTASTVTSPPGQQVFSDDFSNPQSGWVPDNNQDDNGSASYVNGGYQVTAVKTEPPLNTYSVSSPFTTTLPSMASTVDAAVLGGIPADGAGVRCDQGSRNGLRYTFQANGDQTWVIFQLGGSGQEAIAQGKSSAIRTGSASNTITGQCTEVGNGATHLTMTVNGVVVGSATYNHGGGPISWHTALTVYRSTTSPQIVVRFTNFRTYNAGSS